MHFWVHLLFWGLLKVLFFATYFFEDFLKSFFFTFSDSKPLCPQDPPWDPTRSFVLLLNSNSVAVFLIPCQKNGSGTFAQIWKLEPEEQMLPRFVRGNSRKTSLDSRFDRFQFLRNPLFQLPWDCWHLRNSLCTSVALAGWKIIQLPENAANLGLIC